MTMPVFTIKAKDALAVEAVEAYRQLCVKYHLDDQAYQVSLAIEEIRQWQDTHEDQMQLPDHRHVSVSDI